MQGVFAAVETAATSIEKSFLGKARNEQKKWAIRTHALLQKPDRFFATILVCEMFMLVVSATMVTQYCLVHFGGNFVFISTIILALTSFFIGQFIPKISALAVPARIMRALSGPVWVIEAVVGPVVYLFSKFAKAAALVFRSRTGADVIRSTDIVYALSEYEKESSLIASRLFNFSKRIVAEVMIPLQAVHVSQKGRELEALTWKVARLPVYDEENRSIVGIFNCKDYLYTGKVKLRLPYYVRNSDRCLPVFLAMKEKAEHLAIVRDDNRAPLGIVTLEDLIEELVGEIRDEK
jgi:CBS domain containing-hemolysin-like protein